MPRPRPGAGGGRPGGGIGRAAAAKGARAGGPREGAARPPGAAAGVRSGGGGGAPLVEKMTRRAGGERRRGEGAAGCGSAAAALLVPLASAGGETVRHEARACSSAPCMSILARHTTAPRLHTARTAHASCRPAPSVSRTSRGRISAALGGDVETRAPGRRLADLVVAAKLVRSIRAARRRSPFEGVLPDAEPRWGRGEGRRPRRGPARVCPARRAVTFSRSCRTPDRPATNGYRAHGAPAAAELGLQRLGGRWRARASILAAAALLPPRVRGLPGFAREASRWGDSPPAARACRRRSGAAALLSSRCLTAGGIRARWPARTAPPLASCRRHRDDVLRPRERRGGARAEGHRTAGRPLRLGAALAEDVHGSRIRSTSAEGGARARGGRALPQTPSRAAASWLVLRHGQRRRGARAAAFQGGRCNTRACGRRPRRRRHNTARAAPTSTGTGGTSASAQPGLAARKPATTAADPARPATQRASRVVEAIESTSRVEQAERVDSAGQHVGQPGNGARHLELQQGGTHARR